MRTAAEARPMSEEDLMRIFSPAVLVWWVNLTKARAAAAVDGFVCDSAIARASLPSRRRERFRHPSCGRGWRGLWRPSGGAEAPLLPGRGDADRPPKLPPVPAAHLPGRHGRAVANRDRLSVAGDLQARRQRTRTAGGAVGHRSRRADRPSALGRRGSRARFGAVRHADHRRRLELLVLRSRRLETVRGRGQVARKRGNRPEPDPQRFRGGRSGSRSGSPRRVVDVRRRRGRTDRCRDGRPDRRAGARHAPPRLRGGRSAGRPNPPDRGRSTGCSRASRHRCRGRRSARWSGSASRRCCARPWSGSTTSR